MKKQLKPFQQVLVRCAENNEWVCDLYSHYNSDAEYHICVGGRYECCIPYDGNEALLGTTDAPKPKRWRAKDEAYYYFVDSTFNVSSERETDAPIDGYRYEIGNYFKTKEAAEAIADKFKAVLKG